VPLEKIVESSTIFSKGTEPQYSKKIYTVQKIVEKELH
jgi:hypothetical protein